MVQLSLTSHECLSLLICLEKIVDNKDIATVRQKVRDHVLGIMKEHERKLFDMWEQTTQKKVDQLSEVMLIDNDELENNEQVYPRKKSTRKGRGRAHRGQST